MLTEKEIKSLKAKEKPYKVTDSGGLYIYVLTSGSKSWRIKYRYEGKEKTHTIGLYPAFSLAEARKALADLKLNLKQGLDPSAEKKAEEQAKLAEVENIFSNVVTKWLETTKSDKSPKHKQDIVSKLERFVYPTFKNRDINTITAKEMLECMRKMEKKGIIETTKKTLGICSQVFSFALGEGQVNANICAGLGKQLKTAKSKHYPYITDRAKLGALLRAIDNYHANKLIGLAMQVLPLVFTRPSELVNAKWEEIDFKNALWTIPPERMKRDKKHLVPLSTQALKLFQELHAITSDSEYLFTNWNTGKPITIEGVRKGIYVLGYGEEMKPHGFRHTASTLLNELGYNRDWIEKQLAHSSENTVRGIYNHAEYLPERRKMLQEYADYLDTLKREI